MTDLRLALEGRLEDVLAEELAKAEKAVTGAMREATRGLKEELRDQTRQAGLGNRLPRTWRDQVYPRGTTSLGAAGLVFSKAPKLAIVFDQGATIRARDADWLAIPTENAPQKGIGRKRISPSNFPENRFGRLRFVFLRNSRVALLVVDKLRRSRGKRGGFRKASDAALRRGDFENGVVMFVLVPQARIKPKIDTAFSGRKWQARVPFLIERQFRQLDAGDPTVTG